MAYGYWGTILRVNLSNGSVTLEQRDDAFYRAYLGGRGLISYFLLNELKPDVDPLSPANRLVFAAGVVTGGPVGGGRNSVGAKSPLTGGFGDGEVGGYWGAELKRAGFDALIVEGKAERPVYLWITDGQAQIRDGKELWGKTTGECDDLIKRELGDPLTRVAQIGPAGENLVRYACVINDLNRAAGRCGTGAVMGSKNLKAVAVRGRRQVPLANADGLRNRAKWLQENVPVLAKGLHDTGTSGVVFGLNRAGGLPTRNFQEGCFEGSPKIDGRAMRDTILLARRSCWTCPVQCKREVKVDEPYRVAPRYGGPEYETTAALGSNCGVDNLAAVAKGHELCSAYGLDTISTGATIAFAMECHERGILDQDIDGLKPTFGDADAMLELIERIAYRRGIGELLAEGTSRASRAIGKGAEELAMHVKGQEFPMHEPRWKQGMGLGYAVSPTGADHCHNIHDNLYAKEGPFMEHMRSLGIAQPLPVDDLSANKARMVMVEGNWQTMLNCLVLCHQIPLSTEQIVEVVRDSTGWDVSASELLAVGQRCTTLNRVFNLAHGITSKDDALPKRCFEPLPSGPLKGVALELSEFEQAKLAYYELAGWNANGVPTAAKLEELGISWAMRQIAESAVE